jgi:hypothetical protein
MLSHTPSWRSAQLVKHRDFTFLPNYGFTALCWTLAALSVSCSFTQSVLLLAWGSDRSKAHRTTQTQNKRTQTSMPQVGLEPTIPVLERAKTVHALDRAAAVIGIM